MQENMQDDPSHTELPKKQCVNSSISEYSLWLSWVCSCQEEKNLEREKRCIPEEIIKKNNNPNVLNFMKSSTK